MGGVVILRFQLLEAERADGIRHERGAAIAEVVEVLIDHQTRQPMPWPEDFRRLFERYLVAGG